MNNYLGFKFYRIRKNISQKDAAKELGITPVMLCYYENGKSEPNLETLLKMSELYETSIDHILKYPQYAKSEPKPKQEHVSKDYIDIIKLFEEFFACYKEKVEKNKRVEREMPRKRYQLNKLERNKKDT